MARPRTDDPGSGTPSPPASNASILQQAGAYSDGNTIFTVTLGSLPTLGNYLLAIGGCLGSSSATLPVGFTSLATAYGVNQAPSNDAQINGSYRLIQSGDGATWSFPAMGQGGAYGSAGYLIEVDGSSIAPLAAIPPFNPWNILNLVYSNGIGFTYKTALLISAGFYFGAPGDISAGNWTSFPGAITTGWTAMSYEDSSSYYGTLAVISNDTVGPGTIAAGIAYNPINYFNPCAGYIILGCQ